MPAKKPYRENMPLYLFITLLTFFTACGLLGGDDTGGLLRVTPISSVEVALQIQAPKGSDITVERDGHPRFSFRVHQADTVLYEKNLEPATSYVWKAINHNISNPRTGTAERQATTLDTTSHAFIWQKFEFGEYSSSSIKDVAIIDEDNIWAVGEIYMNDSTGNPDFTPYNAAHWDGEEWEVKRIPYYYQGDAFYSTIRSIIAFNQDDIWFGIANMIHWDGSEFITVDIPDNAFSARINNIWGRSGSDLYVVGNNGDVVHYNGETWQKLESGTSLNINDIWGSKNPRTGKWEVLAVAYNSFSSNEKRVLSIQNETVSSLPVEGLGPGMYTVWFAAGKRYFVGGNDLYQTFDPGKSWEINTLLQLGFRGSKAAVRGNGLNDIVVVGTYGLVMHFNGAGWQHYDEQTLLNPAGSYTSLDIKGDMAAAGGAHNGKGLVLIGKRE